MRSRAGVADIDFVMPIHIESLNEVLQNVEHGKDILLCWTMRAMNCCMPDLQHRGHRVAFDHGDVPRFLSGSREADARR